MVITLCEDEPTAGLVCNARSSLVIPRIKNWQVSRELVSYAAHLLEESKWNVVVVMSTIEPQEQLAPLDGCCAAADDQT